MEGKINFAATKDTSGNKPHYKGFLTIGEDVHEFAVWPAKNGNGFSGKYKPKTIKEAQEIIKEHAESITEIPF